MLALGPSEQQPKAQPKSSVRFNKKTTPEPTKAEPQPKPEPPKPEPQPKPEPPKPNVRVNKKTTPKAEPKAEPAPPKENKQTSLEIDKTLKASYWKSQNLAYIKTQLELRGKRFEPGQLTGSQNEYDPISCFGKKG